MGNRRNQKVFIITKAGNTVTVKTLIRHSAQINAKDSEGRTALIYASIKGHDDALDVLGADLNIKDAVKNSSELYASLVCDNL